MDEIVDEEMDDIKTSNSKFPSDSSRKIVSKSLVKENSTAFEELEEPDYAKQGLINNEPTNGNGDNNATGVMNSGRPVVPLTLSASTVGALLPSHKGKMTDKSVVVNSNNNLSNTFIDNSLSPSIPVVTPAAFNKQRSVLVPKADFKSIGASDIHNKGSNIGTNNQVSIQQPISPKPQTASPSTQDMMENRKNQIVSEMLAKLKPFVDSKGILAEDTDFGSFATLMEGEKQAVQRTLVLTVLLNRPKDKAPDPVYARLVLDDRVLQLLLVYFNEAYKEKNMLVIKILDLLARLPLTVAKLVDIKFGKIVKKLIAMEADTFTQNDTLIRDKAKALFEQWSLMARQEDSRRKPNNADDGKLGKIETVEKQEKKKPVAVENKDFFDAAPPTSFPPSRGTAILERVARSGKEALDTRPLSADDIHKAKKKRMYMEAAGLVEKAIPETKPAVDPLTVPDRYHRIERFETQKESQLNIERSPVLPPAKDEHVIVEPQQSEFKRRKRVSFPEAMEQLCQVRYFEVADDSSQLRDIKSITTDKREASFAFDQLRKEMQAEMEWREPEEVLGAPDLPKEVTSQPRMPKDKTVGVLRSPTELKEITEDSLHGLHEEPKVIPLKDRNSPLTHPVIRKIPREEEENLDQINNQPINTIDPNLLNSLLSNPALLQSIFSANTSPIGFPLMFPPPPPNFPLPPHTFPSSNRQGSSTLMDGSSVDSLHQRRHTGGNHKSSMKKKTNQGNFKQSSVPIICKFFKPGKPDSCKWRDKCKFQHVDS